MMFVCHISWVGVLLLIDVGMGYTYPGPSYPMPMPQPPNMYGGQSLPQALPGYGIRAYDYSGSGDGPYPSMYGGFSGLVNSQSSSSSGHLADTKNRIDDYLAKTDALGKKRLSVSVDYLNTPLEYQYLSQYHGFQHPLANTPLGDIFNIPKLSSGSDVDYGTQYTQDGSGQSRSVSAYGQPQQAYGQQSYISPPSQPYPQKPCPYCQPSYPSMPGPLYQQQSGYQFSQPPMPYQSTPSQYQVGQQSYVQPSQPNQGAVYSQQGQGTPYQQPSQGGAYPQSNQPSQGGAYPQSNQPSQGGAYQESSQGSPYQQPTQYNQAQGYQQATPSPFSQSSGQQQYSQPQTTSYTSTPAPNYMGSQTGSQFSLKTASAVTGAQSSSPST